MSAPFLDPYGELVRIKTMEELAPTPTSGNDEVEAMCAEAETWAKVKSGSQAALFKAVGLLRKLCAERAQYQKDAERYRWLRDEADLSVRDVFGHCEQINAGLDAAIDAAIASKEANPANSAIGALPETE